MSRKRNFSDWNKPDPRSVWMPASLRTLETWMLRAITRGGAGESPEVIDRAKSILAERHAPRAPHPEHALSRHELHLHEGLGTAVIRHKQLWFLSGRQKA
jgi:hypothetical protein